MTKFTEEQIEELRLLMENEYKKSFTTDDAKLAALNLMALFNLVAESGFRSEE